MRVAIYSAISGANENLPAERGWMDEAKLKARRGFNFVAWKALGLTNFDAWVYEDRRNSNVGDMAIRLSIEQLFRRAASCPVQFMEIQWGELNDQTVDQVNEKCDLFVVGGSGYFHLDEKGGCSDRLGSDLRYFRKIRVPQVVFGAGVNVNLADSRGARVNPTVEASKLLQEVLVGMRAVSVRDALSKEILQPLSLCDIRVVPDPAIMFADIGDARRPIVDDAERGRPLVGLNFGFQSNFSSEIFRANLGTYLSVLKNLRHRYDPRFLYFSHTDSERLIPGLLRSCGFDVQSVVGSATEFIDVYRCLDVHVCQMLHSSILALSVNVPTVNMAYDLKNRGFFELMNLGEFCIPIRPLDAELLLTLIEKCMLENIQIRTRVSIRKEELAHNLMSFAKECTSIVNLQ